MSARPAADPLERLRAASAERGLAAARDWKRRAPDRRIVGCLPVWAPTVLVEALGMRAVALGGDEQAPEPVRADGRLQSFVCALVRDVLEAALDGAYADLDAVIVPSVCDAARNLAAVLGRALAPRPVIYLHLPQATASPHARGYLEAELRRAAAILEGVAGRNLDGAGFERAARDADRLAAAVRRLRALRRERPDAFPASDLRVALRGAAALPAADGAALFEALAGRSARGAGSRRDRIRVRLAGAFCEPPPAGLLAAIEDAGCAIVDEDLFPGLAFFGTAIPGREGGLRDPPARLADALLGRAHPVPCTVRHDPRRDAVEDVVAAARAAAGGPARLDAILLASPKFCEPAGSDAVRIERALRASGVPVAALSYDERLGAFEPARSRAEALAESILFAPVAEAGP